MVFFAKTKQLRNNKLNAEFAIATAQAAFPGENKKIQALRDIVTKCGDITDPDRCVASSKILACAGFNAQSKSVIKWKLWNLLSILSNQNS